MSRLTAQLKLRRRPRVRLAWRVARKRERCGRGGHILDLGVKVPYRLCWWELLAEQQGCRPRGGI